MLGFASACLNLVANSKDSQWMGVDERIDLIMDHLPSSHDILGGFNINQVGYLHTPLSLLCSTDKKFHASGYLAL